jgi:thiamine biosynthesis protein ThiC
MKEKNNNKSSEQFQNQTQFSIEYVESRINWEKKYHKKFQKPKSSKFCINEETQDEEKSKTQHNMCQTPLCGNKHRKRK